MKLNDCQSSLFKREMEEGKDIEYEEMTPMSGTPISKNLGTENTPVSRDKSGSGSNQVERLICMLLMILGVLFFSFSSGYLTSLISNMDSANSELNRKTALLNKINK